MARKFNPSVLFEARRFDRIPRPYPSLEAGLDAVKSGKKGMEVLGFPDWFSSDRYESFDELLRMVCGRGLVLAIYGELVRAARFEEHMPFVYAVRPQELWRIPAYLVLQSTAFEERAWSSAAEAQSSALLGYTKKQRAKWLAWQRQDQAGWSGKTVYALLLKQQRRLVVALGKRCFGPAEALDGTTFFFHQSKPDIKQDAIDLLPKDLTLARVGLERNASLALFGPVRKWGGGLVSAAVPKKLASSTSAGLRSNVQFLTRKGWV